MNDELRKSLAEVEVIAKGAPLGNRNAAKDYKGHLHAEDGRVIASTYVHPDKILGAYFPNQARSEALRSLKNLEPKKVKELGEKLALPKLSDIEETRTTLKSYIRNYLPTSK